MGNTESDKLYGEILAVAAILAKKDGIEAGTEYIEKMIGQVFKIGYYYGWEN